MHFVTKQLQWHNLIQIESANLQKTYEHKIRIRTDTEQQRTNSRKSMETQTYEHGMRRVAFDQWETVSGG